MRSRKLPPPNETFIHLQYLFKFGTRPKDSRPKPCVSLYCVPLSGCCNFFSLLHVVHLNLGSHVLYNSWAGDSETDYCQCGLADFVRPAARAPPRSGVLSHLEVPPCVASIKFWTPVSVYLPLYLHVFTSPFYIFVILYHSTIYA